MEIEWAKKDGKKGSLVVTERGLYFQSYDDTESFLGLLGDAIAINRTGIFGTIKMTEKLRLSSDQRSPEFARNLRDKEGLDALVEKGIAEFIAWTNVQEIAKRWLRKEVLIISAQGAKIKIREPIEFDDLYQDLLGYVGRFENRKGYRKES